VSQKKLRLFPGGSESSVPTGLRPTPAGNLIPRTAQMIKCLFLRGIRTRAWWAFVLAGGRAWGIFFLLRPASEGLFGLNSPGLLEGGPYRVRNLTFAGKRICVKRAESVLRALAQFFPLRFEMAEKNRTGRVVWRESENRHNRGIGSVCSGASVPGLPNGSMESSRLPNWSMGSSLGGTWLVEGFPGQVRWAR
jgi:hypothetical protein